MSMQFGPQGPQWGAQGQVPMGPPPPPAKKGLSTGCIIAIFAVLGFAGLVGGIVFYIAYKIGTNKDVQNVMGAIGDGAKIVAEAQTAPGTNELRALGCEQAMALDSAKMTKLIGGLVDAGVPPAPPEVERIVICQMTSYATPPACDDAAKAYARGASPRTKFMLSVSANKRTTCGGIYGPTGALVTPMPAGAAAP